MCVQWRWARAHDSIDITGEGGALATRKSGDKNWLYRPAVCGEVLQAEGEAYAEFTWVSGRWLMVGVARAGGDPSSVGDGLSGTAERHAGTLQQLQLPQPASFQHYSVLKAGECIMHSI